MNHLAKIEAKKDKVYVKNEAGSTSNIIREEPKKKIKRMKNVSIVNIFHGTRNIENEKDIDEVISVIKDKLKK